MSASPAPLSRRVLIAAAAALGLGLAGSLTACSSGESSSLAAQADSADGKGYVSGDGSVTEYEQGERSKPLEFSGTLFNGEKMTAQQLRGKPAVVNFWYAGCAPCRAEAPHLADLHEKYGDRVAFLGVNLRDEKGTAEAFERTFGVEYPSIEDRQGQVLLQMSEFVPAQAVPTTLVLDAEGRVAARILGQVDESVLNTLIQDVLHES